ncbi:hypothetical protein E2C01_050260 [Portunus trituberculatus]|uniref:Uncharacterized protein n=1 Tax=Portunus trituberculatus TaxID=210409 RepID=A0A5B7GG88_PORTR|nr:hypothetical protein [Portunus trituberculatus]
MFDDTSQEIIAHKKDNSATWTAGQLNTKTNTAEAKSPSMDATNQAILAVGICALALQEEERVKQQRKRRMWTQKWLTGKEERKFFREPVPRR